MGDAFNLKINEKEIFEKKCIIVTLLFNEKYILKK